MARKILIFDSSSIISLSLNNLLYLLEKLKKENILFLVTEDVKKEVVDTPLKIKKYELEALMIFQLIQKKILEMPEAIGVDKIELEIATSDILEAANHLFMANKEWIKIISQGEASCIALSLLLNKKGMENVLVIDERTARMLCENPENLRELMERKLHTTVSMNKERIKELVGCKIIRSSELCVVAFKKGVLGLVNGKTQILDALLYATKYKGCAISFNEIEEIKKVEKAV